MYGQREKVMMITQVIKYKHALIKIMSFVHQSKNVMTHVLLYAFCHLAIIPKLKKILI